MRHGSDIWHATHTLLNFKHGCAILWTGARHTCALRLFLSRLKETTMQLYYSPGACSLSTHIILREAGYPFELEKVDLGRKKSTRGEDYATINPKGYVPALKLDDGRLLTENIAIDEYLADHRQESGLAP